MGNAETDKHSLRKALTDKLICQFWNKNAYDF
jgi:hypothetical protein